MYHRWVDTRARDIIMWYWSADTLFWQLSIDHNMDVQYQVSGSDSGEKVWAFTLVALWCGRKGESTYGHVTTKIHRMEME